MIYAKIISETKEDNKYRVVLYFYGRPNVCKALQYRLSDSPLSPLAFLAIEGFVPVTDTLFTKEMDEKDDLV